MTGQTEYAELMARLNVVQLESRDTPAAFVAADWAPGFNPFPGVTTDPGFQVEVFNGDFRGLGVQDTVFVAGVGGDLEVAFHSGGTPGVPNVQVLDPWSGDLVGASPGLGDTYFAGILGGNPDYRGGGSATVAHAGGHDVLAVAGLAGAGPVVFVVDAAGKHVTITPLLVGDPNYRGGMVLDSGDVTEPVGQLIDNAILAVPLPGGGGGGVLTAIDPATGTVTDSFFFAPPDYRSTDPLHGYSLQQYGQALFDGVWVQNITNPDGTVTAWGMQDHQAHGTFGG